LENVDKENSPDDDSEEEQRIIFYLNPIMTNEFKSVLKNFLRGKKVVLNKYALSEECTRKLEIFFIENKLHVVKMKYVIDFQMVFLGEAILCVFDGQELIHSSLSKKYSFWEHICSFLKVKHLFVDTDPDVLFFWQRRDARINESQFREIRRLTCVNYNQGKRRGHFPVTENFRPLRVVRCREGVFHQNLLTCEVDLDAYGLIVIDFGVLEEESPLFHEPLKVRS
jgi:hypothetical protein